ncbi:MAG: AAA family ATPase [Actinobacteria bacterium]|nr:AAA family ATPase [Actinomycetota bacterium]MBE3114828.1 AAA family ATPase [Actinomycetota bacterium]
MRLISIEYDNWGICRAIIEGDKGIEYCTNIDLEKDNEQAWCSCEANVFKQQIPCKHINFLVNKLDRSKMVNKKDEMVRIPTGSKIVDDLLGGGVPFKLVTALFGEPMTGKSWLCYQIGVNNIKLTGKETLLIDTEGITPVDLKSILGKLSKRFEISEKELESKFRMIKTYDDKQIQSIQKLMMMFGYLPKLELSEKGGGKYKVIFNHCEETLTDKELKNISLIIIDSLTKPVKDSVGSETSNLPARAQIIERLFGKLYQVAELYNIAVIVLHHASVNPMTVGYKDAGHAYGGNPIYYNSKYILQIHNGTKAEKEIKCAENDNEEWKIEARRIQLIRRPDEQSTGIKIPIRLQKDKGFVDF